MSPAAVLATPLPGLVTGPATLSEGEALELLLTLAPWTLGLSLIHI